MLFPSHRCVLKMDHHCRILLQVCNRAKGKGSGSGGLFVEEILSDSVPKTEWNLLKIIVQSK